MRVALDTNVLACADKPQNDPAFQILQLLLGRDHVLYVSPFLFDELSRVLRYPSLQKLHGLADSEIDASSAGLQISQRRLKTTVGTP